jgi:hypothetical protein
MGVLDTTYHDTCTISRFSETKVNDITMQTMSIVYDNIRCALSQSTTSFRETTKGVLPEQKISYKLFLHTSYTVKVGDNVEVSANGMTVNAKVDSFFRYPSHQEILLRVERYV